MEIIQSNDEKQLCNTTVNKIHGLEIQRNRATMLGQVYAKILVLSGHMCIVFTSNQLMVMFSLANYFRYA